MGWLEIIQKKSPEAKIRIIWITVAIVGVLLIGIWIVSARTQKNVPKDTTLFNSIGQGINDVKSNYKK